MITKKDVLKEWVEYGNCKGIYCSECPYQIHSNKCLMSNLIRIGAMAILRQNRKKFDPNKILTCVTADKAKVGMRGYFADDLSELKINFNSNALYELLSIHSEGYIYRFGNTIDDYVLFYPIDEVEE